MNTAKKAFTGVFLYLTCALTAHSQEFSVPDHIYFAGIELHLSKGLRKNIEAQVLQMQKSKTYFQNKVKLADLYFPIIEAALAAEDVPSDFKYLAIQESSLQSDVVSTSNAVGYWQFKKEAATEVGLVINNDVDERKHILEASRGAAKYLKKNYLITSNWLYALIAYNTGPAGVKPFVESKYIGASEMKLDENLHWYAVKFLAHKLAYEDKVGYEKPDFFLLAYPTYAKGRTLAMVAEQSGISDELIKNYNKWLSAKYIPDDKGYNVIVPVPYNSRYEIAQKMGINLNAEPEKPLIAAHKPVDNSHKPTELSKEEIFLFTTNNDLKAVIARAGDNVAKLAFAGKVSMAKFRQYNEMERFEEAIPGKIYYFETKNSKALVPFHTVKKGETLWDIAQNYGVKSQKIRKYNRMNDEDALQVGQVLYLRFKRPEKEPIKIMENTDSPVETARQSGNIEKQPKEANKPINLNKIETTPVLPLNTVVSSSVSTVSSAPVTQAAATYAEPAATVYKAAFTLPDSANKYHLVVQGQTLYSLSRHYGVKVDSIKKWNNLGNDGLKFNQLIIVEKKQPSTQRSYKLYQVPTVANLSQVADEVKTTPQKIMQWNSKKSDVVMPGELLRIYD